MTLSSVPAELSDSDYVIIGLAHCFVKQDGKVVPIQVVEPVPSAYVEALFKGVPTSYETLYGAQLGEVVNDSQPTLDHLSLGPSNVQFCENFVERTRAAARTYQTRTDLQTTLPHGQSFSEMNFSTEKKRVLNAAHHVSADDNVKQHEYTHMTL